MTLWSGPAVVKKKKDSSALPQKLLFCLFCFVFLGGVNAVAVTPVEKVVQLLEDLKAEAEAEGETEASTYDRFACFCRSATEEKSARIQTEQDNIEVLVASIEEHEGVSKAKALEISELDSQIAAVAKETQEIEQIRDVEVTKYEEQSAELEQSLTSLEKAMAELGGPSATLLLSARQVSFVRGSIVNAHKLGVRSGPGRAIAAMLQGTSGLRNAEILATLKELEKGFQDRQEEIDAVEAQSGKDHVATMEAKRSQTSSLQASKVAAAEARDAADGVAAVARGDLLDEQALLKDDQLYLHDVTRQCEEKAREFDERSKVRAKEVAAVVKALEILESKVADKDEVNKRAALMAAHSSVVAASFLQVGSQQLSQQRQRSPRESHLLSSPPLALSQRRGGSERTTRVFEHLGSAASRLQSSILTAFAVKLHGRVRSEPFTKVKKMIQDLMQRLLDEAAEEATKKGYCDTESRKGALTRDKHMEKVAKLNTGLEKLEALKGGLGEELSDLSADLDELRDKFPKIAALREEEKVENEATIETAKAGAAAVKDALKVLKDFYKAAKEGKVSLRQARASPVDEDSTDGKKLGKYKGNQQKAGGILAMLDVIASDFTRTVKVTLTFEQDAVAAFAAFERATKTSIAEKEVAQARSTTSLEGVEAQLAQDMELLSQRMGMLDDTLRELEELQPACVGAGQSYAERVAKRQGEIDALKSAVCILDPDQVESQCQ